MKKDFKFVEALIDYDHEGVTTEIMTILYMPYSKLCLALDDQKNTVLRQIILSSVLLAVKEGNINALDKMLSRVFQKGIQPAPKSNLMEKYAHLDQAKLIELARSESEP